MSYRFCVLGNCQAPGIAASLGRLVPGCTAEGYQLSQLRGEQRERVVADLPSFDVIFSTPVSVGKAGPLSTDRLRDVSRTVVLYPTIAFSGLHPDCTYAEADRTHVRNVIGPYHSAIVAAAWLEGLPPDRAVLLFNSFTYASLGYFEDFDAAAALMMRDAARFGFDYSCFVEESTRSVFMHTINHPRVDILFRTAAQALAKAEITANPDAEPPSDDLAGYVWPVYPEIAGRLRLDGDLVFRTPKRSLELEAYVAQAFECYRSGPAVFSAPRIDRAREFIRTNVRRT